MRFLVDAQLPPALCRWLEAQGHEAAHVAMLMPGETPDADIAAYAAKGGWVLVTKDEDFLTRHPPGAYALLWLRLGNASNRASNRNLIAWLAPSLAHIVTLLEAGETLVEVR